MSETEQTEQTEPTEEVAPAKPIRARRQFIAHHPDTGETRRFRRGEVVPADWVTPYWHPSLIDAPIPPDPDTGEERPSAEEVDPFPKYRELKTVEDVVMWIEQADEFDDRLARARYAKKVEEAGRRRVGILTHCESVIKHATAVEV